MAVLGGNISTTGTILAIGVLYVLFKLLRFGHREKHLPPGPPTIPILGNAHLIPKTELYKKLKEWSDKYGSVYSLKIGRGTIIVLNDRRAVHNLMDKRSAIYSDRSEELQHDIAFRGENIATMDATPLWRAQRKIISQALTPTRLDSEIAQIQEAEISGLMFDLLETPKDFAKHVMRTTASMGSIVLYGHRAPNYENFWGSAVYEAIHALNKAIDPGTYPPLEQFPLLKYIPGIGASARKRAENCYNTTSRIWTEARERVEKRRKTSGKRNSILDRFLDEEVVSDVPINDVLLNNFMGAVMQGAADTTSCAMLTHILFLGKHPEVQRKAQIELDRVCGEERMPLWSDFKDVPYMNCIIKEGQRVRPIVPTGVPHRLRQDDWYEGMLIPKNALVFIPAYALHHTHYDDPHSYNPDRYLNHPRLAMDYAGSPEYENRDHYSYGAGRRICVGIHLAERTQWRILARMLWAFHIEPVIDEVTGEKVELNTNAYESGFLFEPKPYKVKFTPRSEKHAEVVRRDFKLVEDFLRQWE